jgi:hypothetical protein
LACKEQPNMILLSHSLNMGESVMNALGPLFAIHDRQDRPR